MAPHTSSLQSRAVTSLNPHWSEKHMVSNILSVLCRFFSCLSSAYQASLDVPWLCRVFSQAEPKNIDENNCLQLSFKTELQSTSYDINKMQRRDTGCSEFTWSHKYEPLLPILPVMLLRVTRYLYICMYVYVFIYIYLNLPCWYHKFKASDW